VQFLEVTWRRSGKVRRFAAGTTARYALHAINGKLEPGAPPALHVEAVKDGEEPVCFGPSAPLADYGSGWRLQSVTAQDVPGVNGAPPPGVVLYSIGILFARIFFSESRTDGIRRQTDWLLRGFLQGRSDAQAAKDVLDRENLWSTGIYLTKILLAFVFIFLLGGLLTYLLDKLPDMVQLASAPESL
jgi:hypothetical protein